VGERRPAVVGQGGVEDRRERFGIRRVAGSQDVGGAGRDAVERVSRGLAGAADEVVRVEVHRAAALADLVAGPAGRVAGDQAVRDRSAVGRAQDAAAVVDRRVAGEGAGDDREAAVAGDGWPRRTPAECRRRVRLGDQNHPGVGADAASRTHAGIAAEGAIGERQVPGGAYKNSAAAISALIATDGAAGERHRARRS